MDSKELDKSTENTTQTLGAQTDAMSLPQSRNDRYLYKIGLATLALAVSVPLTHGTPWNAGIATPALGVKGGVIRRDPNPVLDIRSDTLVRRADSPTDVCTRWAHQCESFTRLSQNVLTE